MPPSIRMTSPVGAEAHQDYVIDVGSRVETLVATIEGSDAITIRDIVVSHTVAVDQDPGGDIGIDGEIPDGVGDEVQYVEDPPVGAGSPFQVGNGDRATVTVIGRPQAVAGYHAATLRIAGFAAPRLLDVGYYAGEIRIETLDTPPVLYRGYARSLTLRVTLAGSMGNQLSIAAASPADSSRAIVVPPYSGSVLTGLVITCPSASFLSGLHQISLVVEGLAAGPVYSAIEVDVRDGPPPRVGAVEQIPGIWDAMAAAMIHVRLLFVGFRCLAESDELSLSDEPYFLLAAFNSNRGEWKDDWSGVIENVDAGETVPIEREIYAGRTTWLTVTVTVMEDDDGDPEMVRSILEDAYDKASEKIVEKVATMPLIGGPVAAAGALVALIVAKPAITEAVSEAVTDALGFENDIVNSVTIALTPQELRTYIAEPPTDFYGLPAHFATPAIARRGEGAYVALFRVVAE